MADFEHVRLTSQSITQLSWNTVPLGQSPCVMMRTRPRQRICGKRSFITESCSTTAGSQTIELKAVHAGGNHES